MKKEKHINTTYIKEVFENLLISILTIPYSIAFLILYILFNFFRFFGIITLCISLPINYWITWLFKLKKEIPVEKVIDWLMIDRFTLVRYISKHSTIRNSLYIDIIIIISITIILGFIGIRYGSICIGISLGLYGETIIKDK